MRRLIASSLSALLLTLGVPLAGTANGTAASVFGQLVDAGGRGSSGMTVELLKNGATIGSTVSGSDGRFTMNGIAPGTYVVRTVVNGQPAGVQVTLKPGETAPVIVVLPSMVTAAAQAQLASLLANLSTTLAGVAGATVVTEAVESAAADADEDEIVDALQSGQLVQVLAQALASVSANLTPAQQTAIANTLTQIVASLPSGADQQVAQDIGAALTAVSTGGTATIGGVTIPANPVNNSNPASGSGTL